MLGKKLSKLIYLSKKKIKNFFKLERKTVAGTSKPYYKKNDMTLLRKKLIFYPD